MNLVQIQERLKDLPTQAIMGYANGQNPQVPPYLALGELNRRKQMEQKAAQPPQGTVKDNIEQQVGAMEMQKMRPMAPQMPQQMPQMPQMPPQSAPAMPDAAMAMAAGGLARLPIREMNFGSGGIIAFAEGGDEGEELTKSEAKAILKRMKQREGTESRDVVEPPPEVDNTIPGFEAGNRYAQEMDKANRRPARLTPQQMEANVKQPDLAEQIPGQRSQAPASTGSMPGEVERNIGNTMGAMPGASAAKGFQGGARGLMALLGNLPNMLRGSSGQGGEAPMGDADQNLGAAIMAQAKEKPQAAAPVAAPISRPTSQMTPQQMERAMVNTAPPAGVASLPSVAPQRAPAPVRPPVAAAPPPVKSAAQLYQEKLLSGKGLADLPPEYAPPKLSPIGEEYMNYLAEREGKRKENLTKNEKMEQDRARRDLFNSLIAGGEATRGQKGIGALLSGTGRSLGESLTAAEERSIAFQQKQQDLADNDAKTKFEIANLRRAEELGNSKLIYESKVKLAELTNQRTQIIGNTANQMAQNESSERVARQNNLTQLEVARINQVTSMRPGETERLMQQYADIKRSRGEAAAEEFMKTVERVKTGSKPQLAAEANAIKRLQLADKDDNYKMQARIADDPKQKPEARARAQEIMSSIERRNGIIDSSGGPTVGSVQEGFRFKGGNPADKNNWEKV